MKIKLLYLTLILMNVLLHAQQNPQLGATLQLISSFNYPTNWFVDIMKSAKPFSPVGGPWLPGKPALDAQGWPTEPFSVWVKHRIYPGDEGMYHLSFDGNASLKIEDSAIQILNKIYDPITNKTTATIFISSSSSQLTLFFETLMSPSIRNIKLISPGFDPNNYPTFRPEWLSHISKFPVLRFMNWNAANLNMSREWNERRLVNDGTQCSFYTEDTLEAKYVAKGVAWEYVIELCNLLQKDAWINIPTLATDDYVQQLATLLKNNLNSNLNIYIEYGNEMWSFNTIAGTINFYEAKKEVLAGNSPLNQNGETDEEVWSMRRYAKRSKEIADIFFNVYGLNNPYGRIRPVLGYHNDRPETNLRKLLEFIQQNYGAPKNYFYGTASAPFLGKKSGFHVGMTVDSYINYLEFSLDTMFSPTSNILDQGLAWTKYYELNFLAHEAGGFHDASFTLPDNLSELEKKAIRDTLAKAQLDPRLTSIYNDYLNNWFSYGGPGSVFTWFVGGASDYSLGDCFGLQKDITDSLNIKNIFIKNFIQGTQPDQTAGHNISQAVDTRKYAGYPDTWNQVSKNTQIDQGLSQLYLLNATKAGSYQLRLVKDRATKDVSRYEISVNNSPAKLITDAVGNQTPGVDTISIGQFAFNKGANALQIKNISRCYPNYSLLFDLKIVSSDDQEIVSSVIYPNPVSMNDKIQIHSNEIITSIKVFNIDGKEINHIAHINSNSYQLTNPKNRGIYSIQINYSSGIMDVQKIVVE
jgi:hypothetical protein